MYGSIKSWMNCQLGFNQKALQLGKDCGCYFVDILMEVMFLNLYINNLEGNRKESVMKRSWHWQFIQSRHEFQQKTSWYYFPFLLLTAKSSFYYNLYSEDFIYLERGKKGGKKKRKKSVTEKKSSIENRKRIKRVGVDENRFLCY